MGNGTPALLNPSELIGGCWKQLSQKLYQNKTTQQIIHQKRLSFSSQEEMCYVFNCLLKRMNNYNPNVLKIVYLRKFVQKTSICQCSKRFIILLYVEHLHYTLQDLVKPNQGPHEAIYNSTHQSKCICLHVLKGSLFLKQRYGPFLVTDRNIWIELPQLAHYTQKKPYSYSFVTPENPQKNEKNLTKPQFIKSIKVKLWISSQQEQNFPDQSCEEKKMCESIIQLIGQKLIPAKLCKCYANGEELGEYGRVHSLKVLVEKIKNDHETRNREHVGQFGRNCESKKQPSGLATRIMTPLNSKQPAAHPVPMLNLFEKQFFSGPTYQILTERKYPPVQYNRKVIQNGELLATKRPNLREPFSKIEDIRMNGQPQQHQKMKDQLVQNRENNLSDILSENFSLQKHKQDSQFPSHLVIKTTKSEDCNIQIVSNDTIMQKLLADTQLGDNMKNQYHQNSARMNSNQSSVNILINQRESSSLHEDENADIFKLNLDFQKNKCQIDKVDKGTNPTDRTKIQLSSKGDSKKQYRTIFTTRDNVEITTASFEPISRAGSLFKPATYANDQVPLSDRDERIQIQFGESQLDYFDTDSESENKVSRQSHEDNNNNKKKQQYHKVPQKSDKYENRQKSIMPENMNETNNVQNQSQTSMYDKTSTHQSIQNGCLEQFLTFHTPQRQQQALQFQMPQKIMNNLQSLGKVIRNSRIVQLPQSEYLISEHNSCTQSQDVSIKQSKRQSDNHHDTNNQLKTSFITEKCGKNSKIQKKQSITSIVGSKPVIAKSETQQFYHTKNGEDRYKQIKQSQEVCSQASNPKFSFHKDNQRSSFSELNIQQSNLIDSEIVYDKSSKLKTKLHNQIPQGSNIEKEETKKSSKIKKLQLKEQFNKVLNLIKDGPAQTFNENKDKLIRQQSNTQITKDGYNVNANQEVFVKAIVSKDQSQNELPNVAFEDCKQLMECKAKVTQKNVINGQDQKQPRMRNKQAIISVTAQQLLRLTTSGHEENSIKQKVRIKKAEFAQLKSEMKSLLL